MTTLTSPKWNLLTLCLLSIPAFAVDLDERLFDTFYLEGEKATYVLTLRPDKTFEMVAPDGSKISSTYRATERDLGLAGSRSTRRFNYGFDGGNLILSPTDKDTAGDDMLSRLPPTQFGAAAKFHSKANWNNRLRPVPVPPPPVASPNPPPVANAPLAVGTFTFADTQGNAHRLVLINDDQRFEYWTPENRKVAGRFAYRNSELTLITDRQQRHFDIRAGNGGMLLTRSERDGTNQRDELGTMPPQDRNPAFWKLVPQGPVNPPPPHVPHIPGGISGIEVLRGIERDQGTPIAQTHADFLAFMASGNRDLLYGRFSDARTNFERALSLKPDNQEARDGSAQSQGWSLLVQGDQFRRDREMWRARDMYKQAVAVWPPLRDEVEARTKRFGNDAGPRPGSGPDLTRLEQQVHQLVKANRIDEALRASQEAERARPDSLRLVQLNDSVERIVTIDRVSAGAVTVLEKSKAAAVEAQQIERRDATSRRVLEFSERQQVLLQAQPQQARTRLYASDYDGVTGTLADAKAQARETHVELDAASKRFAQKAKGEEGLKIGDFVVLGDQDAEKWKDTARKFRLLATEAKVLAD